MIPIIAKAALATANKGTRGKAPVKQPKAAGKPNEKHNLSSQDQIKK